MFHETHKCRGCELLEARAMLSGDGVLPPLDDPGTAGPEETGPAEMLPVCVAPAVWDVDRDGRFTQVDLDHLMDPSQSCPGQPDDCVPGDMDQDGDFDQLDLVHIQIEAKHRDGQTLCTPGDANRDGRFNQLDLVQVLQSAKYITGEPATWGTGDFNGDGLFNQRDLVAALQAGNYQPIGPGEK